jgi:hypothetical protein
MIYSSPYPFDGVERCMSGDAEAIMKFAVLCDGKDILKHDFMESMLEWEDFGPIKMPRLKSGLGIDKVRKAIKGLWPRLSKKAKANYFAVQYNAAVTYIHECMDNIHAEFGDDVVTSHSLPTTNDMLGPFLKGEKV